VRAIQAANGEPSLCRYIISNSNSALNVLEVMALARLAGWPPGAIPLDIVPLFETIDDLRHAEGIMRRLYAHPAYAAHLQSRGDSQNIMLGFSDGTKDGGYITANWSIHKAKRDLTRVSREAGVRAVFFDGRGGPPARGGGNTHKFYRSLGADIEHDEIQLTIQGQTISFSPRAWKTNSSRPTRPTSRPKTSACSIASRASAATPTRSSAKIRSSSPTSKR
jgi:phosphoenolpyruvate carboxylase